MGDEDIWVTIGGRVKKVTEKAFGIELEADGGSLLWLPKSQLKGVNDRDDEVVLAAGDEVTTALLPAWLVREKGLEEAPPF